MVNRVQSSSHTCCTVSGQGALQGRTILVADDEPAIRELLQDILEPEGARTMLTASGGEALQAIQAHRFDLAILDIWMPPPGGLKIVEHLRAVGNSLPVVIITAHTHVQPHPQHAQSYAYEWLTKPFELEAVRAAVLRGVEQQSAA